MYNRIIKLTILTLALGVCLTAVAQDVAEPHEIAATLDCAVCHTCDTPTAQYPCLRECPAEEAGPSPADAPDIAILDQLEDIYGPVSFNHKAHAEMSAINGGCADCHHHTAGEQIPACRACHGETPNAERLNQPGLRGAYHRQCLECHRDWSHSNGCQNCHAPEGAEPALLANLTNDGSVLTSEHAALNADTTFVYDTTEAFETKVTFHHGDHTNVFGLDCATCHQDESCSKCHDAGGPALREWAEPHEDCSACHAKIIEEDCTFCHTEKERPRFNHATRTEFDVAKWHGETTCSACHTKPQVFAGLEPACTSCHEADWQPEEFNHAITGKELDAAHEPLPCAACHTEGVGTAARCDMCHESASGPEHDDDDEEDDEDDEDEDEHEMEDD